MKKIQALGLARLLYEAGRPRQPAALRRHGAVAGVPGAGGIGEGQRRRTAGGNLFEGRRAALGRGEQVAGGERRRERPRKRGAAVLLHEAGDRHRRQAEAAGAFRDSESRPAQLDHGRPQVVTPGGSAGRLRVRFRGDQRVQPVHRQVLGKELARGILEQGALVAKAEVGRLRHGVLLR